MEIAVWSPRRGGSAQVSSPGQRPRGRKRSCIGHSRYASVSFWNLASARKPRTPFPQNFKSGSAERAEPPRLSYAGPSPGVMARLCCPGRECGRQLAVLLKATRSAFERGTPLRPLPDYYSNACVCGLRSLIHA